MLIADPDAGADADADAYYMSWSIPRFHDSTIPQSGKCKRGETVEPEGSCERVHEKRWGRLGGVNDCYLYPSFESTNRAWIWS